MKNDATGPSPEAIHPDYAEQPKPAVVCVYSGGVIVDRVPAEVCGRTITLEKPIGIVDGNTCWMVML